MQHERRVRLFRNGRNQALRIPREFELPGNEAIVRKEGDRLIVEPVQRRSLLALLATWKPGEEDFPNIDEKLLPLTTWILRMADIVCLLDTNILSNLNQAPTGVSYSRPMPDCLKLPNGPAGTITP